MCAAMPIVLCPISTVLSLLIVCTLLLQASIWSGYFVLGVLSVHAVAAVLVWMSRIVAGCSALGVGDRARVYTVGAFLHFPCSAESLSYPVFIRVPCL